MDNEQALQQCEQDRENEHTKSWYCEVCQQEECICEDNDELTLNSMDRF